MTDVMAGARERQERKYPSLTVVVCTRNRGDSVSRAVDSILGGDYADFELIVVDQSTDDLTEVSMQRYMSDARVRYQRTSTTGVSVARNTAIASAAGDTIAITDDDCEARPTWLRELSDAFAVDSGIGIVFGNLLPAPHDPAMGFVPSYLRSDSVLARGIAQKHHVDGVGACMAFKRSVWLALGGFDEMLGAGAPFKAGEEIDFAIRALLAGYCIYETPTVAVVHHGFRTWEQAKGLIEGYMHGLGAALMKQLKCRQYAILGVMGRLAWRWAFERPAADYGHRPPRLLRLLAFLRGAAAAASTPVNRTTGHYVTPSA
ncbi:MAG: glycosyltransferase family 2 protein [Chromatiales bacterium]